MADPVQTLTFLAWARDRVSHLATTPAGGRMQAVTTVTLTSRGSDGAVAGSETRAVPFLLAGPADVIGLAPDAILRRYPAPGVLDHESDRCPYVELADPALPWRYTPAATPAASSAALHPWLVLIVGVEGVELTVTDGRVTIEVSAQTNAHTLGAPSSACRFAHVQVDAAGHRTARILCGRRLQPGTDYLAAVVPAYDATGARSWTGAAPVTLEAYDTWRFRTAVPAGSFEDLAARLRPGDAPPTTGRAPVRYPRLEAAPELDVRGALVAMTPDGPAADAPLPAPIAEDLAALQLPARDSDGRPIVALPRYGEAWDRAVPDGSVWARTLNRDPRHRGVAGLGLEVGIRFQEALVGDALAQLGALQEARQRVRHAVMGVAASRALWRRRVPAEPAERLWLLGPAMTRLVTSAGTLAERATADDRAIPRGAFSSAARRVLRSGPARRPIAGAAPPAAVLAAANRPPAPAPSAIDGLPLDDAGLRDFDRARRVTIQGGTVPVPRLLAAAEDLAGRTDSRLQTSVGPMVTAMRQAAQQGRAVPWGEALATLAASDSQLIGRRRDPAETVATISRALGSLRARFDDHADDTDMIGLVAELSPLVANDPPVTPVDIAALASGVAAAFDPMTARPPVIERVLSTIDGGIDPAQPMAPPEPCVGLDRPVWADVARAFEEWLLPGVGQLPENCVISLQSNPVFIDALLSGLNTQILAELRWRNIPVATGCTPIRRFWDRVETTTGARADDIVGVHAWAADSRLGDATHRAPGSSGRELVLAVRGDLFRRYPATLVYLRSAHHGPPGGTDFDRDPDDAAPRLLPGFQGRLGDDVAFFGFPQVDAAAIGEHWVVFEEPPAGYRFANDVPSTATAGHAWAAATLAPPVRVLIRGDAVIPGAH